MEHGAGLVEGAVCVVAAVPVLLQEVLLDDLGDVEDELLVLPERGPAHQLDHLVELLVFLEELLADLPAGDEGGVARLVEGLEGLHVLRVADAPVDRREVLLLREPLVEPPEHLHDPEGRGGHRVREVPPRRRHGPHNGDGPLPAPPDGPAPLAGPVGAEGACEPRPLVEERELGPQVGGVPGVCGHLRQSARNLPEGLCPPAGRVRHHCHVEALVPEVLADGDARVHRGLPRRHGHVGRVGHQDGPVHDALPVLLKLRELHEHLAHLVAPLPTADVHDHVRVRVLGQGLADDRLPAPEGPGDRSSAPLCTREEGVQHPLPREQGMAADKLLLDGSRCSHGPAVVHAQLNEAFLRSWCCVLH